ncbi:MAG: molybdenum cofactor guanylyltransferase [Candidatus Lokiarchaeota archaeon]|nr:molybdenum cofactor guanylyltransferase [Candidatus Lokiarchaeota archaeon]
MSTSENSIAFAILIGGKSSRFGTDKGIFEFHGKPLITYQLETLRKFENDIYIVAHSQTQLNSYKEKIEFPENVTFLLDDREFVKDPEVRTPMIGFFTIFKELSKKQIDKAFIFSCDTPLIRYDVIKFMLSEESGYDCCIPQWNNSFLEPLFAIYPIKKALITAEKCVKKENYKLLRLLDISWNINYISVEEDIQRYDEKLLTFINVNNPIDLDKLMIQYKATKGY